MKRIVLLALVSISLSGAAYGQGCSLCAKTAQGLGDKGARGLNGGIIYLAFLPLALMGSVGLIWWKYNRTTA